jgi:flavin reductase (DIM6/NTAB) family NADH-FMN oxidoreductase RutF
VIGRVVHVHAQDGLIDHRRRLDAALLDSIGRMGGNAYCTTRDRFEIERGLGAL